MSAADSLDHFNTLGVRASADRVVAVDSEEALRRIVLETGATGQRLVVLGRGSNVVLQRHYPGVVCLMRTRGLRVGPQRDGTVAVTAAAGEEWHALVRYTLGCGLFGLENLALIPGSVGAAPLQNIGAYGVDLADRLLSLKAMDRGSGEIRNFDRASCKFGYRDSLFKSLQPGRFVILEVTLELSRQPRPATGYPDVQVELRRMGCADPTPVQVAEAVIRVRRRKLPDERRIGNAGSFFKNPVVAAEMVEQLLSAVSGLTVHEVDHAGTTRFKLSAAQLIDRAGWKGARRARVGVWSRQPLVLVNLGGASGADFLRLSEEIRADVLQRFGVTLELEPRVFGES